MTAISQKTGRLTGRRRRSNSERFMEKVRVLPNGCWEWIGWVDKDGYGMFNFRFPDETLKDIRASHAALNLFKGVELPLQFQACHHCDNSSCVNSDHLFQGTQLANIHDMMDKDRHTYGERNHNAVLSDEIVGQIRARRLKGETIVAIAADLGFKESTVGAAARGQNWK